MCFEVPTKASSNRELPTNSEPPSNPEELRCSWLEQQNTINKQRRTINDLEHQILTLSGEVENQRNEAESAKAKLAVTKAGKDDAKSSKNASRALEIHAEARRLQEKTGALPSATRLALASGAKEIIGPLVTRIDETKYRISGIENTIEGITDDIKAKSKLELDLDNAKRRLGVDKVRLKAAREGLGRCIEETAEEISTQLIIQNQMYDECLAKSCQEEPGVMSQLSEIVSKMVNRGKLAVGTEVEMQVGGVIKKARVEKEHVDGTYDLNIWSVVNICNRNYEEGYDVSTGQECASAVPRLRLTKLGGKDTQPIPKNAPRNPKDPKIVAYLYEEAARTKAILDKTVTGAVAAINSTSNHRCEAMIAPLKAQERALLKCLDKYNGQFTRITDIARTTIMCRTLCTVCEVLRWIWTNKCEVLNVLRIKNRLDPAFDASPAGGYRDILINVRFLETNHIAEIQITLAGLLDVKKSGGHTMYKVARLLNLNNPAISQHTGVADTDVLRKVGKGVIRSLDLSGTEIKKEIIMELPTLQCLEARSCAVTKLALTRCTGVIQGSKLESILTPGVIAQLGPTVKVLSLDVLGLTGMIPAALWTSLKVVEELHLDSNKLTGEIPKEVGELKNLQKLSLWGNGLAGPIPKDIGRLKNLEYLYLNGCSLEGSIPVELGELENLKNIYLYRNNLTGSIPKELGKLKNLEVLQLSSCSLEGSIPVELGGLENIKNLNLSENNLTGPIPKELGNLKNLEDLYLHYCSLEGVIPAELGGLENLNDLALYGNNDLTGQKELRAAFGEEHIKNMNAFYL